MFISLNKFQYKIHCSVKRVDYASSLEYPFYTGIQLQLRLLLPKSLVNLRGLSVNNLLLSGLGNACLSQKSIMCFARTHGYRQLPDTVTIY